MAFVTKPFEKTTASSGSDTHTVDLPDDVDPTQSAFYLAAQNLHAKDHQWTSTLAATAEVTIPTTHQPIPVALHEMIHPPVPLANHTGHRCFRLHLNVPARETLATHRTLAIRIPDYLVDQHLRLDLWILARD